jgi:hypothetical protein
MPPSCTAVLSPTSRKGVNSVLATKMGLSLGDYVVTEAGFGADLGAEKFFDIKCRAAGLKPSAAVIVATVRALRYHGGVDVKDVNTAAPEKLKAGLANLGRHIENIAKFGVKAVVAINHFPTDTAEEIDMIKAYCCRTRCRSRAEPRLRERRRRHDRSRPGRASRGGCRQSNFKPLYDLELPIKEKIATIAREIYRADGVDYSADAETALRRIDKLGLEQRAHLHGQDAVQLQRRQGPARRAHRLPHHRARHRDQRWCRLRCAHLRRDHAHARPAGDPCRRRDGHRCERGDQRVELIHAIANSMPKAML